MIRLSRAALAAGALVLALPAAAEVQVGVGRVSVIKAKQAIATVVVGDATIADVTAGGDMSVVVFGKKAGETELILMNQDHEPVLQTRILVSGPVGTNVVNVRRPGEQGMREETWICNTSCTKVGEGK